MAYYLAKNLKFLRKNKGVNQTQVSDLVGKGNTTIANWEKEISEPNISEILIISNYFEVSIDDLLNNELSNTHLLKNDNSQNIDTNTHLNTHPSTHLIFEKEGLSGAPIVPIEDLVRVPLVEFRASAGFGSGSFALENSDVKDYYVIPKLRNKKVDFMIEIDGSSMYPKYNSGDVVACTVIQESAYIQWNKTHVIATKYHGLMVKRVKKGSTDQSLLMVSDNTNYDPFEVPHDEITGIAMVVGVFRME